MKFNINRPPKSYRKQAKINSQREWHKKFAWLPTSVDETKINHGRVLFENYWRKGEYGPSQPGSRNPLRFTKYSKKEYFKKKLNGDFENNKGLSGSIDEVRVSSSNTQAVGRALRDTSAKPLISFSSDSDSGLQ